MQNVDLSRLHSWLSFQLRKRAPNLPRLRPMEWLSLVLCIPVFLLGLQSFSEAFFDFDLLGSLAAVLRLASNRIWATVGWPLPGFLLMAVPLAAMSVQRVWSRKPLSKTQHRWLSHLECNAYGLGILGSVAHLLSGSEKADQALEALGPIGVGLVFWLWCLWIGFEPSESSSNHNPAPAQSNV
jgi:hypothetical protein